jgi:beta-exotoxin I transport system ATP-binding protein
MRGSWIVAAAIETSGLTKTYGATRAVEELDLRVDRGQVFGFLGPNGAGKTTTIRMLLALQRPTAGRAAVLGLDCRRESVEVHRRVGYLPGELALYPRMSARAHFDWFARARGGGAPPLLEELIERFDVVLDRPAKELSKGNRQKVGLVLAFMHRPELLILDEPTSGLDPLMQNEFERLARETLADGRTVFLSSHELDEVQRLADRVAIIRAGRLVTEDSVEELRRRAPQKIEATFPQAVDAALFATMPGVSVLECTDARVALEVSGPIGPVLKTVAERDPLDVISRHADLEELFLGIYREPASGEGASGEGQRES